MQSVATHSLPVRRCRIMRGGTQMRCDSCCGSELGHGTGHLSRLAI